MKRRLSQVAFGLSCLVVLVLLMSGPAQAATCAAAWSCSTSYGTGAQASFNGHNYTMGVLQGRGLPRLRSERRQLVDRQRRLRRHGDGDGDHAGDRHADEPPPRRRRRPPPRTRAPRPPRTRAPRRRRRRRPRPRRGRPRRPNPPTATPTTPPGACTAPTCTTTAVYTGGMQCSLNGHTWQAKWWTQGELPPGSSGVWQDIGACSGGPTTTPTGATPTPTGPTPRRPPRWSTPARTAAAACPQGHHRLLAELQQRRPVPPASRTSPPSTT